jgi:hypothetical protein
MSSFGFYYVQDIPTLIVPGQRNFVVAVYARDVNYANSLFSDIFETAKVTALLQPDISYRLYDVAKKIVKRQ